jgi:hypothetical protein
VSGAVRWVYAALIGTFDRLESGLANLQSDLYTTNLGCIVAHLDRLQAKVDEVKRLQAETEREMVALVPAVLAKAFGN